MQRMRSSSLGFSWHNADQPRCLPPQVRTLTAQRLQQNASLSPLSEDGRAFARDLDDADGQGVAELLNLG